jgi:hypothetical protein
LGIHSTLQTQTHTKRTHTARRFFPNEASYTQNSVWRFFTFRVDTQITNFGSFWSTRLKLKRLRTKALGNSKCRTFFSAAREIPSLAPPHTHTHTHSTVFFLFSGWEKCRRPDPNAEITDTPHSAGHT